MTEYCCKFKGMADALADLRSLTDDRILVLNIPRGLNQRFEHLGAIIRRSLPFPNFLKVRDDLLLEEIRLDTAGPSAGPTTLYTSTVPSAPKPQPSTSEVFLLPSLLAISLHNSLFPSTCSANANT
jgi:hypothetical protein